MFIALDSTGKRIDVADAEKGNDYFCPVCNGGLRVREGSVNIKHFSHISKTECDDFTTDMSEWHRKWQEQFPVKNREVVIEHNGEKHRADVLAYGHVIEFQHSPISLDEFERRNEFYTSAGKKVVWIFDLIEEHKTGRLYCHDEWHKGSISGGKWSWSYPRRIFKYFFPQSHNDITLFFQITETNFCEENEKFYLERVLKTPLITVEDGLQAYFQKFDTIYFPSTKTELLKWIKNRNEYDQTENHILNAPTINPKKRLPKARTVSTNVTPSPSIPKMELSQTEPIVFPPKEEFLKDQYISINGTRYTWCLTCNQIFPETEMSSRQWSRGQCRLCMRKAEKGKP